MLLDREVVTRLWRFQMVLEVTVLNFERQVLLVGVGLLADGLVAAYGGVGLDVVLLVWMRTSQWNHLHIDRPSILGGWQPGLSLLPLIDRPHLVGALGKVWRVDVRDLERRDVEGAVGGCEHL